MLEIKKRLKKEKNINLIIKKLGYKSVLKGAKSLNKFYDSKNLQDWLNSGFYDFHFNSKDLFLKLCEIYNIKNIKINEELKQVFKDNLEKERINKEYVYINTHFKRKNESIFVLAFLENRRYLQLSFDKYKYKSIEDTLSLLSESIKEHYIKNEGKLVIWGNIDTYIYRSTRNSKQYTFNGFGRIIKVDSYI